MNNKPAAQVREDEFELRYFYHLLRARWRWFLLTFAFLCAAGFLYMKLTLPVYQSTASVIVEDSKSGASDIEDFLSSDLFGSNLNLPTEIGILRSRSVFEETIRRLGLDVQYWSTNRVTPVPLYPKTPLHADFDTIVPEFREQTFKVLTLDGGRYELEVEYEGDKLPSFRFAKTLKYGETVKTDYFCFTLNDVSEGRLQPDRSYAFKVRSINRLVAEMLENYTAQPLEKDANIVQLTYRDVVPARALDVLNTISEAYIDRDMRDKAQVASLTLRFVDEQLKTTGSDLGDTERKLQAFKERNKTVDLSEQSRSVLERVNQLDVDRVKTSIELASAKQLYDYVTKYDDLTPLAPTALGIPDPLLVQLVTECQSMQTKRKSLAYGVKADAPAVRILDQQIAENKAALIENIKSIQRRLQTSLNTINSQLGRYEDDIRGVPEMERELLEIKRSVEVNQNIYTYLLQKKAETSIAQATVVSDNKVLDQAVLSEEPVQPDRKIVAAVILLLSLVVPTGLVLAGTLLRTTVMNKEDISNLTTVPVIGVVGHSDDADSNLVVHKRPKSVLAEGFRTVRTNLRFYSTGSGCQTILITSSVGGEGKSFVTLNLATIMALQQQKVVVVGLDLRKPKLFQDFGWSNDIGASSYLAGAAKLDDIIRSSPIPNLDLVISGPIPPNPAELLSKPALREMFDELKHRYDVVIIDTPPIGVVSDAYLVMPNADMVLYMVRQGYSKLEYLRSLDELIQDGRLKQVSILLNDSDFSHSYGYGYGHHYGYVKGNSGYYDMGESERPNSLWSRLFKGRKN
ncbi:MAG: GumC family protein [Bacteroidota bacterium]